MSHKIIKQHDARDCAPASLAMVAAHYGKNAPLSFFRALTKTDKAGTSLQGIKEGAEKIGLDAQCYCGDMKELLSGFANREISFPFIAHIVLNEKATHFVVVFGFENNIFTIGDPAKGLLKMTTEEFESVWTGNIVTFSLTKSFKKDTRKSKSTFRSFLLLLKGQYNKLALVLVLSIVITAIGIAGSFVFEMMIDGFGSNETSCISGECDHAGESHVHSDHTNGISEIISEISFSVYDYSVIFGGIIILYIISAVIQAIRGRIILGVSKKVDMGLSLSYYNHIVDLPVSSILLRQTGDYLARFSDTATIRNAISTASVTLVLDALMTVCCGIVLFIQNKTMFLVTLGIVFIYVIVLIAYRKPINKSNQLVMENNAVLQSYLKESLDGIETVKASNAEHQVKGKLKNRFLNYINAAVKNGRISLSQEIISSTVELVGTVVVLWIGYTFSLSGVLTIGSLMSFYILLGYFISPVKNLVELQPTIQSALVAADRLSDVLDLSIEETDTESKDFPEDIDAWKIENVDFRYGSRELTIEDLSMTVKKGERIAIVGESGSGKTTLAKLLLRFYTPENGTIRINDDNLQDFKINDIRNKIAYVDQNTFLFSDSIKNNLLLANPEASDEDIKEVCDLSKASEFIEELPLKWDMPLDENGANLSGGQRQRLAIARALLKKPKLLILDEATSNLDTVTEAAIKNTLFSLETEMSYIIIAHRLSTIKNCDRIYVMDKGKIVESGTHDELIDKHGKYFTLWNQQ